MELEKLKEIEATLEGLKEKKDSNKELSTKIEANANDLKSAKEEILISAKAELDSAKEEFVSKEEFKTAKEELETAKNELLEYKTALENEKKERATLFAGEQEKKGNSEEKIIENYVREFNAAIRETRKMDEKVFEKASELYIKLKLGFAATDKAVLEQKGIFNSENVKKGVPFLAFKTLREGVNPDGGYLARKPVMGAMQVREFDNLNFRNVAFTQTISSESIDFPIDDGLFAATFNGEESTRSDTDTSQIGVVSIKTTELWARPIATLKMIEDSAINLEAWISEKTLQAFSLKEEEAFMVGDGLNDRPKGLFTYDAWTTYTVYERNKIATETTVDDTTIGDSLIDLFETLPNRAKANAVYLMNPTTWRVILRLKDGESRYLLNANMLAAGYGRTLYGRPVILSDYIAPMFTISGGTVTEISGAKGIACGDMRKTYAIIDRIGLSKIIDNITSMGFVKFGTRKRMGGGVKDFQTCKILAIA